jgi:hypothetical protein
MAIVTHLVRLSGAPSVSARTLRPDDIGALMRAIERFASAHPDGIVNQERFPSRGDP